MSLACLQLQLPGALEKLLVLGIRARPAAFDVVDAQLVQLLGNEQLVVHGERDGLALRAVPERGVERLNLHTIFLCGKQKAIGWFAPPMASQT